MKSNALSSGGSPSRWNSGRTALAMAPSIIEGVPLRKPAALAKLASSRCFSWFSRVVFALRAARQVTLSVWRKTLDLLIGALVIDERRAGAAQPHRHHSHKHDVVRGDRFD